MITLRNRVSRPLALCSALALMAGLVAPVLGVQKAIAAQVTTRQIQLSRATSAATGVTYKVKFNNKTAGSQSFVIDFCADSPIIGQACNTANLGAFTAAGAGFTNIAGAANWTITSTATTVKGSVGTGSALPVGDVEFELTNITNPTIITGNNLSFYARITTYANATQGTYASPVSPGSYIDYGGVALSVNSDITITATVMETLTFCTSLVAPGPGCTATTTPAVTIGSGSPLVLDASRVDTGTAHTQLSTNASSGAVVNLKTVSTTICAGLSRNGGTDNCPIAAINQATPVQIVTGAGRFGLTVDTSTGDAGVTADPSYNGVPTTDTSNRYNLVQTEALSTYGSPLMSSTGPVTNADNLITYAATPTNTTPAGNYTTSQSLIATGTF